MCVASSDDANDAVSYQINREEGKLIYDSITYDGEVMEKYAQQNPKLSFQYVYYRLAKGLAIKRHLLILHSLLVVMVVSYQKLCIVLHQMIISLHYLY